MTDTPKNIYELLLTVQEKLKAPKSQRNTFANYNYRSCEDILEAVKPLLKEQGLLLSLYDELQLIGDRYYVTATAKVINVANPTESHQVSAFAREDEQKKGNDGSQITGAASSYARKYSLNGLFLIDDTKDADTNEQHQQAASSPVQAPASKPAIKQTTTFVGDLIPCEIPGCKSGVKPERVEASRKYNKGHVICYHHSTETDWEHLLTAGGEDHGYPDAPVVEEAA